LSNPSTKQKVNVILLSIGHFFNDFYCNFLPVLLPIIMPRLDLSLTMSGLLVMVMSFTSNVLQPFFGYLMDKRNLSKLLLIAIPFGAFFICMAGYVTTKISLFIIIALSGLAVSSFHPLGSTLVSKVANHKNLGLALSQYVAGGNIGFAFAPLIIVYFTQSYDLKSLPILIIPGLLLSFAYYYTRLYRISTKQDNQKDADNEELNLRTLLCSSSVIKLNTAMALRAWTHVTMSTFLPLLLINRGDTPTFAGGMLTIFLVGAAAGGLIGGYLGDRIGHKKIIILSLLVGVFPTYYFFTHAIIDAFSLLALFLCGAGLQAPQPSSLIWAQRLLPNHAGIASGMMMGLSFGIGSIGTALTAALGDHIGLNNALTLTTLPIFFAALVALWIPFPKENNSV